MGEENISYALIFVYIQDWSVLMLIRFWFWFCDSPGPWLVTTAADMDKLLYVEL